MEKLHTQNLLKICLILSLTALGSAYIAEYVFGIKPCALCMYQRYAYMAMIALSAGVFAFPHKQYPLLLKGTVFFTIINAAVACYQVLVEKGIVATPSFCSATNLGHGSFETFKEALKTQTLPPCNEVAFSLFDISMAGYNALFCIVLALTLIFITRKNQGKPYGFKKTS